MDKDGYISNGELFQVLKMMVGNNLKDTQLQQIVDKTIIHADTDGDGKISFEEFCSVSIVVGFDSAFRKQIVCSLIYIYIIYLPRLNINPYICYFCIMYFHEMTTF